MIEVKEAAGHRSGLVARIIVLTGLALLLLSFVRYFVYSISALKSPHQRDYGEGIVWEQLRLMVEGKAYGPIDGFPAIVFHYPPVYYATVQALSSALGWDVLMTGRTVSFVATLVSAFLIAAIGSAIVRPAGKHSAAIAGAFAGLAAITLPLVEKWALVMRVDMLAIALGLAGIWFALRAISRPSEVYLASFCFVAAMFTKQTSVAAPAAAFAMLLLVKPMTAWRGIAACVAMGSVSLLALTVDTHGGILNHLILYNINRFAVANLWLVPGLIIGQILFFSAAAIGLVHVLKERLPTYRGRAFDEQRLQLVERPQDAALLIALLYLLAKTVMIAMIAKSGANANYLIEWMMACAIFIAPAALIVVKKAVDGPGGSHPSLIKFVVPLALGIPAIASAAAIGLRSSPAERRQANDEYAQLSTMIRTAPQSVISDDMVILLRNGKEVVWEPAIFAELASTGHWDERPLLTRIRARRFSFFITEGGPGIREFEARYTPAVASAMAQAYPDTCLLSKYLIHLPAGTVPLAGSARPGRCPRLRLPS